MIALAMTELRMPYKDVMCMDFLELRGILAVLSEIRKEQQKSFTLPAAGVDGINTGDIDPADYDVSDW
jgi:hypothetical protein